jgi:peptide/nickel transport system permease protein
MTTYIVRRLLQALVLLFFLSILFFLLVRFQPQPLCPYGAYGCVQIQHADQPIATQYFTWVGNTIHGNLGIGSDGQPVSTEIGQKLPPTIVLVGVAVVAQQLVAIPLGILSAVRQYSRFDQALTFLSYLALSIPSFVLGIVLLHLFVVQVKWFPVGGNEDVALPLLLSGDWWSMLVHDPGYILGDLVRHLALPVIVLTATGIAFDSRFMRASMLGALHQDYVRTARAKGLSGRRVIFKHAFRNALLPVLTNFGLYVPTLIGGVVVVEYVFTWGGLGYAFATALGNSGLFYGQGGSDFPFLEGTLLLAALVVLLVNLLVDLAYVWLDPRIRYGADSGR